MAISNWPANQRPRERLLNDGPGALSEAELLAIFLRVGVKGKSAIVLARDLLLRFGSLRRLIDATFAEFAEMPGLGPAKFAQLQAAVELARRALREDLGAGDLLSSPRQVRDFLQLKLAALPHEVFMVLLLDAQNRLLHAEELFRGTLTQTSVFPREVVKLVLRYNAAAAIFAHNHPSGLAEPSRADELLTAALKQALAIVDVKVLDHFIVAAGSAPLSFAERGLL